MSAVLATYLEDFIAEFPPLFTSLQQLSDHIPTAKLIRHVSEPTHTNIYDIELDSTAAEAWVRFYSNPTNLESLLDVLLTLLENSCRLYALTQELAYDYPDEFFSFLSRRPAIRPYFLVQTIILHFHAFHQAYPDVIVGHYSAFCRVFEHLQSKTSWTVPNTTPDALHGSKVGLFYKLVFEAKQIARDKGQYFPFEYDYAHNHDIFDHNNDETTDQTTSTTTTTTPTQPSTTMGDGDGDGDDDDETSEQTNTNTTTITTTTTTIIGANQKKGKKLNANFHRKLLSRANKQNDPEIPSLCERYGFTPDLLGFPNDVEITAPNGEMRTEILTLREQFELVELSTTSKLAIVFEALLDTALYVFEDFTTKLTGGEKLIAFSIVTPLLYMQYLPIETFELLWTVVEHLSSDVASDEDLGAITDIKSQLAPLLFNHHCNRQFNLSATHIQQRMYLPYLPHVPDAAMTLVGAVDYDGSLPRLFYTSVGNCLLNPLYRFHSSEEFLKTARFAIYISLITLYPIWVRTRLLTDPRCEGGTKYYPFSPELGHLEAQTTSKQDLTVWNPFRTITYPFKVEKTFTTFPDNTTKAQYSMIQLPKPDNSRNRHPLTFQDQFGYVAPIGLNTNPGFCAMVEVISVLRTFITHELMKEDFHHMMYMYGVGFYQLLLLCIGLAEQRPYAHELGVDEQMAYDFSQMILHPGLALELRRRGLTDVLFELVVATRNSQHLDQLPQQSINPERPPLNHLTQDQLAFIVRYFQSALTGFTEGGIDDIVRTFSVGNFMQILQYATTAHFATRRLRYRTLFKNDCKPSTKEFSNVQNYDLYIDKSLLTQYQTNFCLLPNENEYQTLRDEDSSMHLANPRLFYSIDALLNNISSVVYNFARSFDGFYSLPSLILSNPSNPHYPRPLGDHYTLFHNLDAYGLVPHKTYCLDSQILLLVHLFLHKNFGEILFMHIASGDYATTNDSDTPANMTSTMLEYLAKLHAFIFEPTILVNTSTCHTESEESTLTPMYAQQYVHEHEFWQSKNPEKKQQFDQQLQERMAKAQAEQEKLEQQQQEEQQEQQEQQEQAGATSTSATTTSATTTTSTEPKPKPNPVFTSYPFTSLPVQPFSNCPTPEGKIPEEVTPSLSERKPHFYTKTFPQNMKRGLYALYVDTLAFIIKGFCFAGFETSRKNNNSKVLQQNFKLSPDLFHNLHADYRDPVTITGKSLELQRKRQAAAKAARSAAPPQAKKLPPGKGKAAVAKAPAKSASTTTPAEEKCPYDVANDRVRCPRRILYQYQSPEMKKAAALGQVEAQKAGQVQPEPPIPIATEFSSTMVQYCIEQFIDLLLAEIPCEIISTLDFTAQKPLPQYIPIGDHPQTLSLSLQDVSSRRFDMTGLSPFNSHRNLNSQPVLVTNTPSHHGFFTALPPDELNTLYKAFDIRNLVSIATLPPTTNNGELCNIIPLDDQSKLDFIPVLGGNLLSAAEQPHQFSSYQLPKPENFLLDPNEIAKFINNCPKSQLESIVPEPLKKIFSSSSSSSPSSLSSQQSSGAFAFSSTPPQYRPFDLSTQTDCLHQCAFLDKNNINSTSLSPPLSVFSFPQPTSAGAPNQHTNTTNAVPPSCFDFPTLKPLTAAQVAEAMEISSKQLFHPDSIQETLPLHWDAIANNTDFPQTALFSPDELYNDDDEDDDDDDEGEDDDGTGPHHQEVGQFLEFLHEHVDDYRNENGAVDIDAALAEFRRQQWENVDDNVDDDEDQDDDNDDDDS